MSDDEILRGIQKLDSLDVRLAAMRDEIRGILSHLNDLKEAQVTLSAKIDLLDVHGSRTHRIARALERIAEKIERTY